MKKTLSIALKVFTYLLVAFTIFMMLFTIITVTTVDKNDRNIFGYKFYIVQTDSMSLSEKNPDAEIYFDAGDMIVSKVSKDPTTLQPGDVITFMSINSSSYGETITHMIREVRVSDSGRVLGYETYGINTGTSDEALVTPDFVLGVYVAKMPAVGRFFAFVKSVPGYITCILVPFLLLIGYNGVNVIRLFRQNKKEQMAEIQAEKDQIEQEREEAKRMMAELMALKAQLSQNAAPAASPAQAEPPVQETENGGE